MLLLPTSLVGYLLTYLVTYHLLTYLTLTLPTIGYCQGLKRFIMKLSKRLLYPKALRHAPLPHAISYSFDTVAIMFKISGINKLFRLVVKLVV